MEYEGRVLFFSATFSPRLFQLRPSLGQYAGRNACETYCEIRYWCMILREIRRKSVSKNPKYEIF